MEVIYGTGNPAKLSYMERALKGLPIQVVGAKQAARQRGLVLPEPDENGNTLLENARIKAEAYFRVFQSPVFSCDSGLYLWRASDEELLPEAQQPGIHVRGRGAKRYSDEELLHRYIGLVQQYGPLKARYKNAVCLIWNKDIRSESMAEDMWGRSFLLTDEPHPKRVKGFPLDCISMDIHTGCYFYDLEDCGQDHLVSNVGFGRFFRHFLQLHNIFQ